jgi:acyl-CoA hydrolase
MTDPHSLTEPSPADAILPHILPGTDLIVPIANGEPVGVLDAVEAAADTLDGVRVHQMHALHDRPTLHGAYGDRLRHISYFLSHITRPCFAAGTIDLVPNDFSEVPDLIKLRARNPIVVAAASMPDRHGYFSLGTSADYVSSFIGRAPFFLEANPQMPRTFGRNQLHVSQVMGWSVRDAPLIEVDPSIPDDVERRIAEYVAERVGHGSVIQAGIGSIPNSVLSLLRDRKNLGIHTELISDGFVDLIECGAANGSSKHNNRTKAVGAFALGTKRLYDFLADNPAVELWPVRYVNSPPIIAQEPKFVSINATIEVDLLGQCASETIGGKYWSSSGGQADFARGAMYSEGGQGFVVLTSTVKHGTVSRIVARLGEGQVVTTLKNTVDKVATEYGIAELRGRTIRERANSLIAIAHPDHRDHLRHEARAMGFI